MSSFIADLGISDYNEILEIQRRLSKLRNENKIGDVVMFLQHPDTYTAGIHFNQDEILDPGVKIVKVERGGALTYHGPGQIVVYMIFNLKERGINIKELILEVQNSIINVLSDYHIIAKGRLDKETGIWIGDRKICSIGFAINSFTTLHGIALNVNTNLKKFGRISPCGFDAEIMTSMSAETGKQVSIREVTERIKESFIDTFNLNNYEKIENLEKLKELAKHQ